MRFVATAAVKDLRRRLADPAALAIWIGIPILLGGLMSLVAGNGGPPRATILVVDQDETILSQLLVTGAGGRAGSGSPFDFVNVTLDEGRRRIDEGDATALLVLPKGFQQSVLQEQPAEIELVTNPAERILPGIVEEGLEIVVEGVFYLQRLFGPVLQRVASGAPGGPSDEQVAALAVEINGRLAALQNVVIPPAIQLDVRVERPDGGPPLAFGQLFLPGILFMSLLFVASGMSGDIWEEKTHGTLRRALTTPQSTYALLAGKLCAGAVLMGVIVTAGLLAGLAFFGIPWTRVPLAIAWCVFAGAALVALMTLLQVVASGQRVAEMLSSIVVFPLMMLGGSFFPFESMPAWMVAIGQWTPNGLAVLRLKELLYGSPSASALLISALGIGVPAAAAFAFTARRLRGRFATG